MNHWKTKNSTKTNRQFERDQHLGKMKYRLRKVDEEERTKEIKEYADKQIQNIFCG